MGGGCKGRDSSARAAQVTQIGGAPTVFRRDGALSGQAGKTVDEGDGEIRKAVHIADREIREALHKGPFAARARKAADLFDLEIGEALNPLNIKIGEAFHDLNAAVQGNAIQRAGVSNLKGEHQFQHVRQIARGSMNRR